MIAGVLQLNSTIGDFAANTRKLVEGYQEAVAKGAEFVLAPELFLCGYPPRDLLLRPDFVEANLAALNETAKSVGPVPLCVGFVDKNSERPGRPLRNAAAVLQNGKIIWRTNKSLLPTYDVFDEDRYFEPAKSIEPFIFNGIKIGITICEDIWNDQDFWTERLYPRDPVKDVIAQGAEILFNISASPWHEGKEQTRLEMLRRVARDEKVPLVYANLIGANDELIFDGHSVALDANGEVIAMGKGFDEQVFVAEVRMQKSECRSRKSGATINHQQSILPGGASVLTSLEQTSIHDSPPTIHEEPIGGANVPASRAIHPPFTIHHSQSHSPFPCREEQLFRALSLGIRDYVRKCGFKSIIIGLSGGIDSALTAVLAVDALGAANVLGVAMPARYSSQGSLTDAEKLAKNLGIRYEVLPIEQPFQAMEKQLEKVFSKLKPNEAEENMQSRLRGVTLMALSNKFGGLVLTTGNKSEMAVGYCTLYGDMNGALAPLADVFKTDVYKISRWVNREREIIPADSISKPPSAELRPDQKDQDSLPPYETLDAILDLYVVKHLSKAEIIAKGFDAAMVSDVLNKTNFSEYKRRQAAPGLKVSPRAFGVGRRIPIAQRFRTTT